MDEYVVGLVFNKISNELIFCDSMVTISWITLVVDVPVMYRLS
jgi:hypothetical protein